MEGTIIVIKHKYVIQGVKYHLISTDICNYLLPGDRVLYKINENNTVIIESLLDRSEQVHLGIVKYIADDFAYVSVPGLPKHVEFAYPLLEGMKELSSCVLYFSMQNTCILQHFDSIRNRAHDKDLFLTLYNSSVNPVEPIYKPLEPFVDIDTIEDLTHLPTFTVDPPGCKDHDDAVSVCDNKIYVHIVDAHNLIEPLSAIDRDALKHSFTLYLSEKIRNILPQELAENQFSLKKDQVRHTITVEYVVDPVTFNIVKSSIYRATIKVKENYTYEAYMKNLNPFLLAFCNHWKYYTLPLPNIQYNVDEKTGELINTLCIYNDDDAHKIIETLMILTNLTVSKHTNSTIPQRFHDKVKNQVPLLTYTDNSTINALLSVKNYRPAIYDDLQKGHFGLGLDTYTHFTSPIRRYADVVVHRHLFGVGYENLTEVLTHINKQEAFVDKLVNLYRLIKLLGYFEKNLERTWDAYVLYMTPVGACVVIADNLYEGFIFSQEKYQTGLKLQVKIKTVNWCMFTTKMVLV